MDKENVQTTECYSALKINELSNHEKRDFPGSPVVKTSASSAGGTGLIPGWRAKIPYASRPENESIHDIVINSIKTLKMLHIKKKN